MNQHQANDAALTADNPRPMSRMSKDWLCKEEVYDLTGRQKYSAQITALRAMRIDIAAIRFDGSPVVLRKSIGISSEPEAAPEWTPDLGDINGPAKKKS